jgi:long-chain acyl-CoA synthetase
MEEARDYEQEFAAYLAKEKNLALMVRSRVKKYGDSKVAVRDKAKGEWISYTWAGLGELIDAAALGLLELGVEEGELVGIFSDNRVEWVVSDFACFTLRAVSVPVYSTNSARELDYIVNHAELAVLFVGNQTQYDKAATIFKDSAYLKKIIIYDGTATIDKSKDVMYFDDLLAMGRCSKKTEKLQQCVSRLASEDLSTVIYTSGTTGEPKGVMLTHKAWFAMLFGTGYHIAITEDDVNLAFLPLSHVFERAWSYHILCGNGRVDYCHDTKALMQFLIESRPHYMCSVPRLWEKIYAKVKDDMDNASPVKQKLFNWSLKVGGQVGNLKKD